MAPLTDNGVAGQAGSVVAAGRGDQRVAPVSPSVRQLLEAYGQPGQPRFRDMRSDFAATHGKIVEEVYAVHVNAVAVLVEQGACYRLRMDYDSGLAPPELATVLRELRFAEREKSALLQHQAQQIFAQKIYTIVAYLFAVWDRVQDPADNAAAEHVINAVKVARSELKGATKYADDAAHRSALTWYLWGLPIGAAIGGLIIVLIWTFPRVLGNQEAIDVSSHVGLALGFGAVGAIVSVMVRITRGSNVDVRQPGRLITMVAGAFRPIIGAVFGAMFFVLIAGGILPLEPGDGVNIGLFYAGLAFLAGFSERWAQDTIVNSAPAFAKPGETGKGQSTSST